MLVLPNLQFNHLPKALDWIQMWGLRRSLISCPVLLQSAVKSREQTNTTGRLGGTEVSNECLPRPSLIHQTGHAERRYRQRNVLQTLPRLTHVLRVWPLKGPGHLTLTAAKRHQCETVPVGFVSSLPLWCTLLTSFRPKQLNLINTPL